MLAVAVRWVVCLVLAWAPGGMAWAQGQARTPAPVRVVVDTQNAPFMFARDGAAAGLYPVLVEAAFREMGTPVQVDAVPWSRALQLIDNAEAGVAGIYKNAERLGKFDFSAPIFVERLLLYARRDRAPRFAGIDDLAGLRIGVIRGWSYGDAFDQARRQGRIEVEEVASDAQNFSKLEQGRLDLLVAVEQAGAAQLAGGAFPSVRALDQPLATNATHLAFHRSAGMRPLLERFDRAVEALRRSGAHQRLAQQALRP